MNFYVVIVLCLGFIIGTSSKMGRIMQGAKATIKEFPYAVSLRNKTDDWHFCGGTIISNRHILTAAHCIFQHTEYLHELQINAGTTNLSDPRASVYDISTIDIHEKFNYVPDSNHDIAILTLKTKIIFNDYQQAIDLIDRDVKTGEYGVICGWGTIDFPNIEAYDELQQSPMKVIDKKKCLDSLLPPIYEEQICLFYKLGVGACKGDSGGPFVIDGKLAGVSSFIVPCALAHPDVYTSVYHHLDFIRSIIGTQKT